MALLEFWKASPQAFEDLAIEQIVAQAGDGALKDGSFCSEELRTYLAQIPSTKIEAYIDRCLSFAFPRSGMVLQDLINELGRRLDYEVTPGRYQGVPNTIGFDGLWLSPENHTIIAEVKTTDAYRISLDTIAKYRSKVLISDASVGSSSILIIVGRDDTGELEAQVRGSQHAWDIRLISVDSLVKLVSLKENSESSDTGRKIRSLLTPMEYTRLDRVIDVVFTTAKDVEAATVSESVEQAEEYDARPVLEKAKSSYEFTDARLLQQKRENIVARFGAEHNTVFVRTSRALYWDSAHQIRLGCTISKRYTKGSYPYWFAYHPQWDDFLKQGLQSFVILGCMDLPFAFALPWKVLAENVDALNTTTTKDGNTYWHIHVIEASTNKYAMLLPKIGSTMSLDFCRTSVEPTAAT